MPSPPPATGPSFRGASLYSGIFDTESDPPASTSLTTPPVAPDTVDGSAPKTPATPATTAWSASLRFAPRRNNATKTKPRPNAAFVAAPPSIAEVDQAASKQVVVEGPPASASPCPDAPGLDQPSGATTQSTESGSNHLKAMQELEAQLSMYRVVEAPPYTLPEETIQRDQQMARKAAENRGDAPASREIDADVERDVDGHDAEEDVNGFLSTAAGKRAAAKRRKRRRKGGSPPPGPNLNADYDPRIPNDYTTFKQIVRERRQAHLAHQRWLSQNDQDPSAAPREQAVSIVTPLHPAASPAQQRALTGEEVYARRLAMSQLAPPSTLDTPQPAPSDVTSSASPSFQHDLATKRTAAAAIAARLASSVPDTTPSGAFSAETDSTPFAERLMAKYGHVQGQGLGAAGNKGILQPLRAGEATGQNKQSHIINTNVDPKAAQEAKLYGSATASSVIVLLNMISHADLYTTQAPPPLPSWRNEAVSSSSANRADEDVIQDIAEECAKFGIVKRIFAHVLASSKTTEHPKQQQQQHAEEVRVFVQFTGEAGGWKAVRALNGRWFQGRMVRALYYDLASFERRDLDQPLAT